MHLYAYDLGLVVCTAVICYQPQHIHMSAASFLKNENHTMTLNLCNPIAADLKCPFIL